MRGSAQRFVASMPVRCDRLSWKHWSRRTGRTEAFLCIDAEAYYKPPRALPAPSPL